MIFDVGVRVVEVGEDIINSSITKRNFYRVHDRDLSAFIRKIQDDGNYVFSVIPLFRPKVMIKDKSAFDGEFSIFRKDIDPRLIRTEHTNYDGM